MKRRLLALVLACTMALSLTACGGSKDAATTAPAEAEIPQQLMQIKPMMHLSSR
ncbi:MAG: hypothetical protein V8S36_08655 [Lachnospiraceae bacterium]